MTREAGRSVEEKVESVQARAHHQQPYVDKGKGKAKDTGTEPTKSLMSRYV